MSSYRERALNSSKKNNTTTRPTSSVSYRERALNKQIQPQVKVQEEPQTQTKIGLTAEDVVRRAAVNQQVKERKENAMQWADAQIKREEEEKKRWDSLSLGEKIADPFKTAEANRKHGELGIEENQAWNDYRSKQNQETLAKAQAATKAREEFELSNDRIGKGNAFTKDFAGYVPQLFGQLGAGLSGAAAGAGAGALGGAGVALAAGQLGPQVIVPEEIATVPAGAVTGAIWGGRGGYVAGNTKYSYDLMAGNAYKTLLDMGVPNEVALELSGDEALISSLIEGAGSVVDLISLGIGKLATKGGTTAAKKVALNRLTAAAKAYGLNLISEPLEEGAQQIVSIETQKKAAEKSGIERNVTEAQDKQSILDSMRAGFNIAAISGLGNVAGNVATNVIKSNLNTNADIKNLPALDDITLRQLTEIDKNIQRGNILPKATQKQEQIPQQLLQQRPIYEVDIEKILPLSNDRMGQRETEQIEQLREDIKQNGIKKPIEIMTNSKGDIVINDGNHRLQIAKELGIKNIPIQYLDSNAQQNIETINADIQTNYSTPSIKEEQLKIIQNSNPAPNEYQTWIRDIDDIKTFEEVIDDEESFVWGDFSKEDAQKALETGEITVYSSNEIKNGNFVSTSYNQAKDYAGGGKVYSKTVPIGDVAWINGDEGQYAKVERANKGSFSMPKNDNQGRQLTTEQQAFFKDSKARDKEGKLLELYHGTNEQFTVFDKNKFNYNEATGDYAGEGFYFTKKSSTAKKYGKNVMKVYLNIKNPLIINNEDDANRYRNTFLGLYEKGDPKYREALGGEYDYFGLLEENPSAIREELQKRGYDGVIDNEYGQYAVFEPNQIKSVDNAKPTNNLDIFDTTNYISPVEDMQKASEFINTATVEDIDTLNKMVEEAEKYPDRIDLQFFAERAREVIEKLSRQQVRQAIMEETGLESYNLDDVNKVSKFRMNITTPVRVIEKVFGKETANKINDNFFKPIKHNEAEKTRRLNKERNDIKELNIKAGSNEDAAIQKYGEGEYVTENGEIIPYTLENLKQDFPETWQKLQNATNVIRNKYDTYLEEINEVLLDNGYDPIPKRKDYFRHFEELNDLFSVIGVPTKVDDIPTDLNGATADLKPGKNFFVNALQRKGNKTTYSAIKGIDGYLDGAMNILYHTKDIQKLRTLDKYIRDTYGQAKGLENIETMTDEQKTKRINQINEGHLSEFAAWLTEYTNALAGKKSRLDRGMEEMFGRRIYKTLNLVKKQVGANMTGLNVNTALSNFISLTQAAPKTNKAAFAKGTVSAFKNIFQKDDFIDKSDFLTTRFGSERLVKNWWQKASDVGQIFMSGTDYFTANVIVRSKYLEFLDKGYSQTEAIKKADEFADRLMAGRGKGDLPTAFESKMLGIVTQFQLEVNNQLDSMFYDTFQEDYAAQSKSKLAKEHPQFYNTMAGTFILGQMFALAFLFNEGKEEATGAEGGAFDPIGIVMDAIKYFTDGNLSFGEATAKVVEDVANILPFASIVTGGGRIPIKEAFPDILSVLKGESKLGDELWSLANLVLPTGGGQIKKTTQGISTFAKGGSYTIDSEGNKKLKYQVEQTPTNALRSALFGKWASEGAKQYIDRGFKALSAKQTEGYEKAIKDGITSEEFYKAYDAQRGIEGLGDLTSPYKKTKIDEATKGLTKQQRTILYETFGVSKEAQESNKKVTDKEAKKQKEKLLKEKTDGKTLPKASQSSTTIPNVSSEIQKELKKALK